MADRLCSTRSTALSAPERICAAASEMVISTSEMMPRTFPRCSIQAMKKQRILLATVVAVFTLVATLPASQAVVRRFGFDDFSKVKRVGDPQFSPDGATLAYVVSTPNLDENRHMASLAKIAAAGGTAQTLVDGEKYVSVSFPRWSPKGDQIAFLSTGPVPGQGGA